MVERIGRDVDPLSWTLLALRVAIVVLAVWAAHLGRASEDVERFQEIAAAHGTPYRDFIVEYAPLEVMVVRVLGEGSLADLAGRVAIVAFVSDVAAWIAISYGWGTRAARTYLVLGTPLLVFIYTRLDLLPIALAAWGAALAIRGQQRASGVSFALAILTKVWPLVLLPGLWVTRRIRAVRWVTASTIIGAGAWVAFAGVDGVRQVVTFRGATGWEVESFVGGFLWAFTSLPVRLEAAAPRVGILDPGVRIGLLVALIGLEALVWFRARRAGNPFGGPALAAVGVLLSVAPVFSLQYVAWLLPWAAVAYDDDHRLGYLVAGAEVLTVTLFALYTTQRMDVAKAVLLIRNGIVVAIPIFWWIGTHGGGSTERAAGD